MDHRAAKAEVRAGGWIGMAMAVLTAGACESARPPVDADIDPGPVLMSEVTPLESPAGPGSAEPFLHTMRDGSVLMSWLEAGDTAHSLRFARWDGMTWDEPRTIVSSSSFFVNWADFPSIIDLSDGRLAAHWLGRSGPGTYAYDVLVAFSDDGGQTWSEPVRPHNDGTETEHGFVTLFESDGQPAAVWLDGRKTAAGTGGPREMTVRFTTFDESGTPAYPGALLDSRTCDCCQTAVAITSTGPVVIYRDRSPDEVRDIAITRLVDGEWTSPTPIHRDGWQINACPVNGPAIDAADDHVAIAWFTAAQDTARVRVAFSSDAGASFGTPFRIDLGNPSGRVDLLLLDDAHALVSWLERTGGTAEVMARIVGSDGTFGEPVAIGGSSAERASGFPKVTLVDGGLLFAWTVPGETSGIRVATILYD